MNLWHNAQSTVFGIVDILCNASQPAGWIASSPSSSLESGFVDVEDELFHQRQKSWTQHTAKTRKHRRQPELHHGPPPAPNLDSDSDTPVQSASPPLPPLAIETSTTSRGAPPPLPFISSKSNKAISEARLDICDANEEKFMWWVNSNATHICCHDQPLSDASFVDSGCAALSFLSGYYSPICKAIVFQTMAHGEPVSRGSLVPFAEFLKHLWGEKRGLVHARLNRSKQVL